MTEEKVIQRAICTAKNLRMDARNRSRKFGAKDLLVHELNDGAAAIEALVGLLRQKETAHGVTGTESGKAGPAPRGRNTTPLL